MTEELDLLRRRLDRERAARKEAERIAENTSRELFVKGRALEAALAAESEARHQIAILLANAEQLARTDPLTGCNNRRAFMEEGERLALLADRHRRPLAAVMLDIDFFKGVNDRHGHPMGDQVLVAFAQVGRASMRKSDVFARLGGEEFALLLPETGPDGAVTLAERVRITLSAQRFECQGEGFGVTASAGVAQYAPGGDSLDSLLKRADNALYRAKTSGRDRTVVWSG